MEYFVEFYASEDDYLAQDKADQDRKNGIKVYRLNYALGNTRMMLYREPEIGDEITIQFGAAELKYQKWFNKLPTSPYVVGKKYPAGDETKIEVFYTGKHFDFEKARNGK